MTISTRSVHCLAPRRRRESLFAAALLFPCFAFVAVFAFYPIIHSLYLSLHRIILGLPGLAQPFVYLENYRQLWGDAVARHALANTFLFVAVSTTCEMLLGLAMALVINQGNHGGKTMKARLRRLLFLLSVALIAAFSILPFLWFIATSLKTQMEITAIPPTLLPSFSSGGSSGPGDRRPPGD